MTLSPLFRSVELAALPGWASDDFSQAFAAFRRSAFHVLSKPYKTGSLGVAFEAFAPAYDAARAVETMNASEARTFFEKHFTPALICPDHTPTPNPSPQGGGGQRSADANSPSPLRGGVRGGGIDQQLAGLVTGFYEPEVEASPIRTPEFTVPMYGRPADLVDVDDANRPAGMDPYLAFARQTPQGLIEYHDRPVIDGGILQGLGLELAWLRSKVDLFFIQVQGAARLHMTDGSLKRVSYAAKSGQRFTAIGRELVAMGELRLEGVTMQSIRAWLAANPGRVDELLHRNRSYVFFRETDLGDPALGPVAAAKVQLTPGRSVAVDRLLHTFGTPFYIDASALTAFGGRPFSRLMIAQDTGSAIVGPARGDLFAGTGDAAGEIAGVVRSNADFYALVPRGLL